MACKGKIEREKRVALFVEKFASQRKELKIKIKDQSLSAQERVKCMFELDRLKAGSPVKSKEKSRDVLLPVVLENI